MTAICFCIKEHPIPRPYSHCVSQELNSKLSPSYILGTMALKILMVVIILADIIAVSLGQSSEGEMVKVNECNTQCVVQ